MREGKLHAERVANRFFVRRFDLARVCEKTAEQIRTDRLAALEELDKLRERISQSGETFNVVEELERSRASHPYISSGETDE